LIAEEIVAGSGLSIRPKALIVTGYGDILDGEAYGGWKRPVS
jgi:hypothetical protein